MLGIRANAQISFTQGPADQVVILRAEIVPSALSETATNDFMLGEGGYTVTTPIPYDGPWFYDTGRSWRQNGQLAENYHPNTSALTSPALVISKAGGLRVTFTHRYDFEYNTARWDGGQFQISVNGRPFAAVIDAAFTQNGYGGKFVDNNSISELHGQPAFTGRSTDYFTQFTTSSAVVGDFNTGETVRIQFLAAADSNTRFQIPSWELKRVDIAQGLDVRSASFSVVTADSRPGENNPPITYQWFRDDGAGVVAIPDANAPSYSLWPAVGDNKARFRCVASVAGFNVVTSRVARLTVAQPGFPPSFLPGPDLLVTANPGPQTILNWATDIREHTNNPPLAAGQHLAFQIQTSQPELFFQPPEISPDGTLTFTPAANACGTAFVTTLLTHEPSNSAFGGDDLSLSHTFTIQILCPDNYCPVASNLSLTVDRERTVAFNLSAYDREGEILSYQISSPPQHGILVWDSQTGLASYTPTNRYCGSDTFKYQASAGPCVSLEASVNLTVLCCPVLEDLAVTVPANTSGGFYSAVIIIGPGGHLIGGDYAFTQRPGHGGILTTATGQAFYYPDFHYVGPDFFRYTLSDGVCTSLQATVTINVADLEPPQIFCPTNFGMEFLGATGAPVNFLVGAWDTLSPASVRCVPPSGTVFPMGETTVQCVATDRSGNSNSCGFTVTILGARAVKERVLAEIAAFSTNTTATSDRQHLDKITRFLTAATNSSFWIDDSHLVTHFGRRVFRFEKYAAYYARLLIRADHGPVPDATAMDWKSRLLKVDRLLAEIAVNEAAERNVEARKITRCREIISRGDVKAAADRTGLAIDYYRNAWNRAIHLHGKPAH